MIRITPQFDPSRFEDYAEHLSFADGGSVDEFRQELGMVLSSNPERVMIVSAFTDDVLIGFIIGLNHPRFVQLAQAWSHPTNSWKVIDEMFARLILWTIGLGKTSIRAQSTRSTEVLYKRFGFVELSKTIEHQIPPDILPRLIEGLKDKTNGKPVSA